EEDEGMAADGDKDQEKEVTEEMGRASEELNWEELRAELFHILLELEETREASVRYQRDYLDLQGQLEEERLLSAEQAETFSRQIRSLKGAAGPLRQRSQASHAFSSLVKNLLAASSRSAVQRPAADGAAAGAEEAGAALGSGGGAAAAAGGRGGGGGEGERHCLAAGGAVSAHRSAAAPPRYRAGVRPGGHRAEG
ncbi:unnamed protein product, partial [Tetraodon nigroviridis]